MMKARTATGPARLIEGKIYEKVMLETVVDDKVSRPRVRPISHFPNHVRVEFPRNVRAAFPIGTRFMATVKVCQKHWKGSLEEKGPPYLSASGIQVIVKSIPNPGIRAKLKPGTKSGRAYEYIWDDL